MPRKKSFDELEILEKIAHLFWQHGYTSVTMDQISDHVSLKKTSLYNAYGDKASIFKKVVDWYSLEVLQKELTVMSKQRKVSEDMTMLLHHFLVQPDSKIISRGCLLTSNLVEMQYTEPELFKYLRQKIEHISKTTEQYFSDAKQRGRLKKTADPVVLAEYFMTLLQGLRVQSRTVGKQIDFENVISLAMGPIIAVETEFKQGKQRFK